ncbi:flagellar biosynthetic protein FliR [Enterovibrio makurazakiensis]|uniref:flagellar biosynthetic protein FliR n=1 Tax=Enterovibrio makurazakiensis TaxID=2910232 RepID=UPI003D24B7D2
MFELTAAQVTAWFGQIWWPFLRIGSFMMLVPIFGGANMPAQVRVGLTMMICIIAAPLMPPMPEVDPLSLDAILIAGREILIGGILALLIELLFSIFMTLGQILSTQMGLGMAMMNDPINGVSIAAIGKYYQLYAVLLFLALNGHLVALEIVVQSFNTWQVGDFPSQHVLDTVITQFNWMIGAALLLSLPAVVAMLLVNIAFGVMNRAAPQLNVFALGFPMTMLLGLMCLFLTLSGIPDNFARLCGEILTLMTRLEG